MVSLLFMFGPLLGTAVAAEPVCAESRSTVSLDATVRRAEDAFRALDVEAFSAAATEAREVLPCLSERLTPRMAARVHRLRGVEAFVAGDAPGAEVAFASARAADPSLSMDLVPDGHSLQLLWGGTPVSSATRPLDPPESGQLFVDGAASEARPTDRPIVAQWVADDAVRFSVWADADTALPSYPIALDRGPTAEARRRARRRKIGLGVLGGGAALAVTAGALHAGAAASKATYEADHPEWTRDDLLRVKGRTNALGTAAGVVGACALAVGGLGVALQW